MNFACLHCSQNLEIADEWSGHAVDCPTCQQALIVPAVAVATPVPEDAPRPPAKPRPPMLRRPTPGSFTPAKPPRRATGGFGRFLRILLLLAVAGYGYAMAHFQESPQEVWKRLIALVEPVATPTVATAPALAPVPVFTLASTPVPQSDSIPAPAPVLASDSTPVPASDPIPVPAQEVTPAPEPPPLPRKPVKPAAGFPTPRYQSPGVILTREDLELLKANITAGKEPWKSGYTMLASEGRSQLTYKMAGPYAEIKRAPNENLNPWRSDMVAIWNLSRMWYFTGDTAYAQKAHDILLAWATTHTKFGGRESMLDLGDYAAAFVGGADILRGTWPGWTAADTAAVKKYFNEVLIPASNPYGESQFGAANKGALALCAKGLMAIFNEDTALLQTIVYQIRTLAHIGLRSTNDLGALGDSGRDQGHAHGQMVSLAILAEALWKQGIDIYSDFDNRLLTVGEYFARVNERVPTPFIPFGTTDSYYLSAPPGGGAGGNVALNLIHGAYVVRNGLPAPYIIQRRQRMPVDGGSFMFVKEVDRSVATPLVSPPIPVTTSITKGFSKVEIGDAAPRGGASYAGGVWTVQGGGSEIWKANDSCHFTYKAITGNGAIIAKVESVQNTSPSAKAGVMMRTSLSEGAPRAWMAISGGGNLEQNMPNLTVYGGTNYGNKVLARSMTSYWLKLERMGNIITGYLSPDGTSWAATNVGRIDAPVPDTVYVGLVVCSADNGTLNTATFRHVQVTGGDGGAPIVTPAAPGAVLASPGDGVVPLRWQSSFGAASYTVKRAKSSGGPYAIVASGIATPSYTDRAVTNGTTYYYVVTATNPAGTSGDSPEDSTTPVRPSVNIAIGGTATASVIGTGPAEAFDRNIRSRWFNHDQGSTGWLQYDLATGAARTITGYSVASAFDVPGRDPRDWEFQGSNDGSTWTTLDTQSDHTFIDRFQLKTFKVPRPDAYRSYRLNITANNGAKGTHVAEFGLFIDTDAPPAAVMAGDQSSSSTPTPETGQIPGSNPIFRDHFTADPAALVLGDTVYVYVGHDDAKLGQGFVMPQWFCYSSQDMKTWKPHGPIMRPEQFAFARAGTAWAAQMVEKDGKFFFYTTLRRMENNEHCIGVAVGSSPTGPFQDARGTPLVTDGMTTDSSRRNADIDPTVFIDDDGTPWMMWGNGDFYLAKLKRNMIDLDGPIVKVPHQNVAEGPWLVKRKGIYYNVYAADVPGTKPEQIAYATAEKVTGPWTYRGLVTGPAKVGFTIHPAVIEFRGQWYFFYHDGSTSLNGLPGGDVRRSVCLEYLYFNADGSIQPITQTSQGVSVPPSR